MRRISFLRGLLVLPLLSPLALAPFARLGEPASSMFMLSAMALLFGGIPYLVFCACALWVLRRADSDRFLRFLALAPIWFLIPMNFGVLIAELASGSDDLEFQTFWAYSGLALGFGYAYVVVGFAIYWLGDLMNWFPARRITSP